jgi:putative lipoic acid-binding regulatory protein
MTDSSNQDTLMTYPCHFQVKAMGLNTPDFENTVIEIVQRHLDDQEKIRSNSNPSKRNKYLSVSVHFTATSRRQLDEIYIALTNEPAVLVAL